MSWPAWTSSTGRRTGTAVYDAWLALLRTANSRFAFTDPPFRHSLPMTLAFAATGSRPTAVLTGPRHRLGAGPGPAGLDPLADTYDTVCVRVEQHRLAATAGLVWNGDLPPPCSRCFSTPPIAPAFDAGASAASKGPAQPLWINCLPVPVAIGVLYSAGRYHKSHHRFYRRAIAAVD